MKRYCDYIHKCKDKNKKDVKKYIQTIIDNSHYKNDVDSKDILLYHHDDLKNYDHALLYLSELSETNLKYSRKIELNVNGSTYHFNMSDIHIEIDFELLGVNEVTVFQEFYNHLVENICPRHKVMYVCCIHFERVKKELIKIWYSFLENCNIRFIMLCDRLSCIPIDIIDNVCVFSYRNKDTNHDEFIHQQVVNEIVDIIKCKKYKVQSNRTVIYNIFVNNMNVHNIISRTTMELNEQNYFDNIDFITVTKNISHMMKLYNNNYRSIFHIERILMYLMNINSI